MATVSSKIIIDHTKVAADLTDFPVYINLADMPQGFWDTATSGGGDIRCYDINDNELAREVVSCDTTLQSGELYIKANLSSTVGTILKVVVDGVSSDYLPTDTYGSQAVWDEYGHVWHFTDMTDSTGNGTNLTGPTPTIVSGQLGLAMHIDRVENGGFATGLTGVYGSGHWTVTGWVNSDSSAQWQCLVNLYHYDALMIECNDYPQHPGIYDSSTMHPYNTATLFGEWAHYCWVRDSSNTNAPILFYLNGEYIGQITTTTALHLNYIGDGLGGALDNITVTESARPPDWISTEYNNQSSPTTFYAIENFVQAPIPYSDGYAYMYENVGYSAPNSGQGYGYSYENVGYAVPNSGEGYGYSYENVGYSAPNSGEGYGYSYENVTLYVIDNDNMLPPVIN